MSKKRELLRTNEFNQDRCKDDMIADIEKSSYSHDHCSALVKLLANNSDVVFGHNTWMIIRMLSHAFSKVTSIR